MTIFFPLCSFIRPCNETLPIIGAVGYRRYRKQKCYIRDKKNGTWDLYWGIKTRQVSKLFTVICLHCYPGEQVKRKEKEILQHLITSLNMQFVNHPRIIFHAPIYHLNLCLWSGTPLTQFLSTHSHQIIGCHNTSDHYLVILNIPTTTIQHSHTTSAYLDISALP